MRVLKNISDLRSYLSTTDSKIGCLADTGFLYAHSYDDDRLFAKATEVFDLLADLQIPIYANVISRLEFIDLIFRKQITLGALKVFEELDPHTAYKDLFNLLRNIRDQNTAVKKRGRSFKIDEGRLKNLRGEIELASGTGGWLQFCAKYSGPMLTTEWQILEEDFGLNFIEILESETSEFFPNALQWSDMVELMGAGGIRGKDAMLANMFLAGRFPLLITGDSDFESCFTGNAADISDKTIFLL